MSRSSFLARAALALLATSVLSTVHAAVFNCVGGSVYVVAHPDDDLLFQSPTLLEDVASGDCITTVFLTSGDSGTGSGYAQSREVGNQVAYAQMYNVDDTYTEFYATFGGQPVLVRTLVAEPQHQKVYFRLPDGGWDTGGFVNTQWQTLRGLYFGTISSITNQPGDATFTLNTLKQAIGQILAARQPNRVRTLDYLSDYGGGDHDDHLTAGRLTADLVGSYASGASLSGFMGYPVQNMAPTMSTSSSEFGAKCDAFFAYTPFDSDECQSLSACAGRGEAYWLQRQYVVTSELATSSSSGAAQAPATLPEGTNIAPLATATAISNEPGSSPHNAIDGITAGYPINEAAEWASNHGRAGAWFKLTWSEPVEISAVVLYDRPNGDDWLQAGTLTIDDGRSLSFTNPINDGSAFVINLPGTFTTTSLLLTVTQVSASTANVGISELRVYGTVGSTPVSSTTSSATSSSTSASSSITSSSTSASSSITSSTTPASSSTTTTSSAPVSSPTSSISGNLARNASASASSWSTATGQTPDKAIDGFVNGYKESGTGDYTKEWATDHQTVGAYLSLQWSSPVTANRVVLYDRPNLNDRITAGTLTFPDGSTLSVPALNNAGAATTLDFVAKTFNQLVLTVTSVSNTTSNVGLAEIEVFYVSGGTTSTTSSAPTSTATSSAATSSTTPATSTTSSWTSASPSSTAAPPEETGSSSLNLAQNATAGASSWAAATSQTPAKAIDGVVSGYKEDGTGDYTKEWASNHERAGAYFTLSWPSSITANRIVLFDRPNLNDQITSGYIVFSDQSTFDIPSLANDGSATTVDFPAKTFDSLVFYVTGASGTTSSVGLAEVQIYYLHNDVERAFFDDVERITFHDVERRGKPVAKWSRQTADKAVDGVVSGYPANYSAEWATDHKTTGAWLLLKWTSPVTINQVVLFDRPNLNDRITNATLRFSDGSLVATGALVNSGAATYVNFTARATTELRFTVVSVAGGTSSAGLAEIEVYNNPDAKIAFSGSNGVLDHLFADLRRSHDLLRRVFDDILRRHHHVLRCAVDLIDTNVVASNDDDHRSGRKHLVAGGLGEQRGGADIVRLSMSSPLIFVDSPSSMYTPSL
ncbi:hypothetical protein JCM10449v2_007954 [Rhodotorula kratochvilovae]